MLPTLTANEARVIGCLMEKSVITPDLYPLTLNALTAACNQKSARNPVMALDPGSVRKTAQDLSKKHLVVIDENFKRGTEKFRQRLCNTTYSELQLDSAQFAIICILLLRGAQTPGELRANSGRLHSFSDNAAVVAALTPLIERQHDPLLVKLPRTAGRRDSEYMHLLCGPVDVEAHAARVEAQSPAEPRERVSLAELERRLSSLEAEVAELKARL